MSPTVDKRPIQFSLDPKSGVPYYKQIILQVEFAIADGRFVTGDQLPTVRSLAVELKINPNTVARAYNELEIRGIVTTQQGTGTFISNRTIRLTEVEREGMLEGLIRPLITKAASYGFAMDEVINAIRDSYEGIEPRGEEKS
ncbi:MAG: GntR family transcriptional regulator [Spirochaetales bacterium]|nr:MAG: GntR family transcriptional regulator [Spirochaetales bacterium]